MLQKVKSFTVVLIFLLLLTGCKTTELPTYKVGEISNDNRVFYEIFVASFYDSNNDKIGDLNGIDEKLDYLTKELGVTGLWLMPIMESPSYHKYDVTDYYKVDSSYGTLEDLKRLAEDCKERNVALIIDLPINHTSNQNPWFQAAFRGDQIYRNYYNFSDKFQSGYEKINDEYYECHFGSHMPDLNLDSLEVREKILNICKTYLDVGVTGFRLDAVSHFYEGNTGKNTEFLSWLYLSLKEINPDVYLVGEAWEPANVIYNLYQSSIPSLFNFPLSQSTGTLISAIRTAAGYTLSKRLEGWYENLPEEAIDAPFLTNHDQTRSASALYGNENFPKLAASIYLLLPGNPFIYYGEEIGMKGGSRSDEDKRTQFVWSSTEEVEGTCNPPTGAIVRELEAGKIEQEKNKNSLLNFYKQVIRIKDANPGLSEGSFTAVDLNNSAICAYRQGDYIVIHNLDPEQTVTVDVSYDEKIATLSCMDTKVKFEDTKIVLPPFSTVVLLSFKN